MNLINKILVATDFSNVAIEIAAHVKELRKINPIHVDLLHVFDPTILELPTPYNYLPGVRSWFQENRGEFRDRGKEELQEFANRIGDDVAIHFREGKPEKCIVEFAEEAETDLIILGRHGHRRLGQLFLGSVAKYVVTHAHCHVLTIMHKNT